MPRKTTRWFRSGVTAADIMQAAAAGVTIVDGAGVADTITAGAIIVATN